MKSKIHEFLNLKIIMMSKKLLLILLLAAAAMPFQNCSKNPQDDPPIVIDTTKKTNNPVNSFKFNNIVNYNLTWDSTNMFGTYRAGSDQTNIVVEGYSGTTYAAFNLRFPGKSVVTYKYTVDNTVNVEVTTGAGVKEKQYRWQDGTGRDMIINITKYDPVGGHIKGTFTANLEEAGSITTGNINAGNFEVYRTADE